MQLLELANEIGIHAKKVANTQGGEYHSPCPNCGGKDRFIIWNSIGRYFCRQCQAKGDIIQFCRDFMGMNFQAACSKANINPDQLKAKQNYPLGNDWQPKTAKLPSELWINKADEFIRTCHLSLMANKQALQLVYERGFTIQTVKHACLGWNQQSQFLSRSAWNLSEIEDEHGQERKLWLPSGIVIPTRSNSDTIKIKIRRNEWKQGDYLPKYVEVSGSMQCLSLFGEQTSVFLVVEAELDALLIQQISNDLCACLALGGATKRPDRATHQLLQKASLILVCLDFDDAGKKAFRFWKETYPQTQFWPVPKEKSPGDAFKAKVDLRQWLIEGLKHYRVE